MTDPWLFALAVLALLATPGPTNTLLAASGAAVGVQRSLRLLPAEVGAYLLAIEAVRWGPGALIAQHPALATGLKLAAACWLLWSATRLWRAAAAPEAAAMVGVGRVALTTLLNPKVLIFALAIFPAGRDAVPAMLFALLCPAVGLGWIAFGCCAAQAKALVTPARVGRVAAAAHVLFAMIVAGAALGVA